MAVHFVSIRPSGCSRVGRGFFCDADDVGPRKREEDGKEDDEEEVDESRRWIGSAGFIRGLADAGIHIACPTATYLLVSLYTLSLKHNCTPARVLGGDSPWVNPRRMNKVFCVLGALRARSGNSFCEAARGRSACDPSTLLRGRSALREWSMPKLLRAPSRRTPDSGYARLTSSSARAIPSFSLSPARNIIRCEIPRDHGDSRIVAKYAGFREEGPLIPEPSCDQESAIDRLERNYGAESLCFDASGISSAYLRLILRDLTPTRRRKI